MEKSASGFRLCLLLVLLSVVLPGIDSAIAQPFPGCTLPFESIRAPHPIDDSCKARGDVADPPVAANDAAHALQNERKNDFCETGSPSAVTFASFAKLQQKLDQKIPAAKTWNREHLPADRSGFAALYTTTNGDTIGEGSIVQFSAWVMKLRRGGAESVNCEGTKKDEIDLHLVLIASSDRENTSECSSVTAEISPHFRPDGWDSQSLLAANDHPLRITGPLMYDASHRPCAGNPPKPGASAPARVSSWEIHPVYGIDVCTKKSLKSCKPSDDSVWVPLDQWQSDDEE